MGDQVKELSSQLNGQGLKPVGIQHTKMLGTVRVPPQVPRVCMEVGAGDLIWNPPGQLYVKLLHESTDLNPLVQF